jgi:hypothetical protein
MKLAAAFVTACIALAVAGVVGASASDSSPVGVSIDLYPTQFCCPQEIGTWQASGAINGSGSYVRSGGRSTGSLDRQDFCQPEHTAAFGEVFVLTGSQGTLTVKAEELVVPTGELCPPSTGVWQVVSGTGAYAGINAHGRSQFVKTPVFDLALTGVVTSHAN